MSGTEKLEIRLVIFDMDGLLFDTERLAYDGWRTAAAASGYEITEDLFRKTVGINSEGTNRIFLDRFGSDFPIDELRRRRWAYIEDYIAGNGVPVKPGARELLVWLKANGYARALATSTARRRVEMLVASACLGNFFDCMVCGDEIVRSKPDPEIFLKVAGAMRVDPSACLVFEDSYAGITAAHRAGMHPVMVPDMLDPTEEILPLLYAGLDSLVQAVPLFERAVRKTPE